LAGVDFQGVVKAYERFRVQAELAKSTSLVVPRLGIVRINLHGPGKGFRSPFVASQVAEEASLVVPGCGTVWID
jgi:hypothetical protein